MDKQGNVYALAAMSPGVGVGVPIKGGYGYVTNHSQDLRNIISGDSFSMSAVAGVGGTLGITSSLESAMAEFDIEPGVELSVSYGNTWFIGNIYE